MNEMSEKLYIPISNLEIEDNKEIKLKNGSISLIENLPFLSKYYIKTKKIITNEKYVIVINRFKGEEERRTLDRVLTVFKLYRDNLVFSNEIFWIEGYDFLPHYTYWIDKNRPLQKYILEIKEIDKFITFWNDYIEISPLNFAVQRYHLTDYRPYLPDRFVDYVESLECLFVPDYNKSKSISARLRERGSKILGENSDSSVERIEEELKNAYNLRSAIVHGDKKKVSKLNNNKEWEEITKPIREYARESIKFFHKESCLNDIEKRIIFLNKRDNIT